MYQKHILDNLRQTSTMRYAQLQPEGVESSHFKYHLDQLIQDGLVVRVERGVYALSDKGKASVDRLSVGRIKPFLTPKVITYTLLKDTENYYLYRKGKEPFLGTLNMVAGKVHLDECTQDAAVREVKEKVGLTIEPPQLRVIAEVRIHQNEQLISHFIAYVFVADYGEESSRLEKIAMVDVQSRQDLAPDLLTLLRAIEKDDKLQSVNLDLSL